MADASASRPKKGTPAFAREYAAAMEQLAATVPAARVIERSGAAKGTLGWLAALYFASAEFRVLDAAMQKRRRAVIEECLRETFKDGSRDVFRDCPLSYVTPAKIRRLRDLKADRPGTAKQFQDRHLLGTEARLALELLLLTGARRGNMVTFGRQHIENGYLRYVPRKTSYRRKEPTYKPIPPRLAEVIAQSPTGDMTFLVTSFGKPFTPAGF